MRRLLLVILVTALLVGCGSFSRTRPQDRPHASAAANSGDGIYVASFVVINVQESSPGLFAAIGFDINTIPLGVPRIGVINRWNGVVGKHKDETRLLDREGRVVASDASELKGEFLQPLMDPDLSQSVGDALDISALLPGTYTVAVFLDGRQYVSYSIRIVAKKGANSSGKGTPN